MTAMLDRPSAQLKPSRAELRARWAELLRDPIVAAIPGKVELNEKGTIEVTPPSTRHGYVQAYLAAELHRLRPDGAAFVEVGIETEIGIRAPDVAWASGDFVRRHGMPSPLPSAPELCIEVLSPSNTTAEMSEKVAAYIAAGAKEVWLVGEQGALQIFGRDGELNSSDIVPDLVLPPVH